MRRCSECKTGASTGNNAEFACRCCKDPPLPFSCNTEFPSIMFLYVLLACPVETAWKCGTNAIVFPPVRGARAFEQADRSLMSKLQFTCLRRTDSFIWATVWRLETVTEAPHSKGLIPERSAVPSSCWAHTRKEGRGDWLTVKENQGHDRRLPWILLAFELVCVRAKEAKVLLFFSSEAQSGFSSVPLWKRNIEGID